jgi:glutaminase
MTDHISLATRQIFNALDIDGSGSVSSQFLLGFLERNGLLRGDQRLAGLMAVLSSIGGLDQDKAMTLEQFNGAISTCILLVSKAVQGKLRVPDFGAFKDVLTEIFAIVEPNESGANADYIPQLAKVDPNQFAISITTVDGQHFSIGDSEKQFCIQSCSKPVSYLIALKQFGAEYVHNSIGMEASGRRFNEMCLKETDEPNRQVPHNPMINAGAIMACSMVFPEKKAQERLDSTIDIWKRLSAGADGKAEAPIGFDEPTYRSESATADRNWCLAYMMKEKKAFPPCFTTLSNTLELYFQICSILSTSKAMSVMAASLANGGLNPLTGEKVFTSQQVRSALPLMLTAGMYDFSGEWAYDIGVPAKSGVGGCVFLCIPNVCGISIWSPRLDKIGNSARGVHVAKEVVKRFAFHNFEVFSGLSRTKIDVTLPNRHYAHNQAMADLLFAASEGDAQALASQSHSGMDIFEGDYDSRTALHLSASEGRVEAIKFLISELNLPEDLAKLNAADRWGSTPLDDALSAQHSEIADLLRAAGAVTGSGVSHSEAKRGADDLQVSPNAPSVIVEAASGNLDNLIKMVASGVNVSVCDYDWRSPLHLAASNGHANVVKYLLSRTGSAQALIANKDRWGNTAADDARREGHPEILALF